MKLNNPTNVFCKTRSNLIKDSMTLLTGKWKIHIISTLLYGGKMRYIDLQKNVEGIGSKMLSKELQDLELNQLITRTVLNTKPLTVEYELTNVGKDLESTINIIMQWGINYRKVLYGQSIEF